MKHALFKISSDGHRLEEVCEVTIPEGRTFPDIILHKAVLYHYSEIGGIFMEADTYDTDKQE